MEPLVQHVQRLDDFPPSVSGVLFDVPDVLMALNSLDGSAAFSG